MTSEYYIKNLYVQFDLPFVLRVVDSIRRETAPDSYEHYFAQFNGVPMMLRFEKQVRNLGGVCFAIEDHRGLFNYSTAQIWFDDRLFRAIGLGRDFRECRDQIMTFALGGLNRFLELYRLETNSYWVHPIRYSTIPHIVMVAIKPNGNDDDSYSFTEYGTGLAIGSLITEQQDSLIRAGIQTDWVPDDLDKFYYNVLDLFDLEEFWSATLAIEIYFEAKMSQLLRAHFLKSGLTAAQAESRFENSSGYHRRVSDLLRSYVLAPELFSDRQQLEDLMQTYNDWSANARELRNAVAHGRRLSVSRAEAANAIKSVNLLLKQLKTRLP